MRARRVYRATPCASGCTAQACKLTPFEGSIKLALKVGARQPPQALSAEISGGLQGAYSRVTDFVLAWRRDAGHEVGGKAFVPLRFEVGEVFQFDWSEEGWLILVPHRPVAMGQIDALLFSRNAVTRIAITSIVPCPAGIDTCEEIARYPVIQMGVARRDINSLGQWDKKNFCQIVFAE